MRTELEFLKSIITNINKRAKEVQVNAPNTLTGKSEGLGELTGLCWVLELLCNRAKEVIEK